MTTYSSPRDISHGFPVIARKVALILAASIVALALEPTEASNVTWDGGGADNNWGTALNWGADIAPVASDALYFDGAVRLTPSNNFTAGTSFTGLTFNSGASAFTLSGNGIALGGDVTNNSAALQTIGLAMSIGTTRTVNAASGDIALSGVLSGAGGLTKTGIGTLTLSGTNTFSGTTTISAGSLAISGGKAIADTGSVNLGTSGANLTLNSSETIGTLNGVAGTTVTLGANSLGINSGGTYAGNISGAVNSQVTLVAGTLTLSGTNNFYKINITGGTTILSGGLALGDTTAVNMSGGGTLMLNSSEMVGNLSSGTGSTIILNNNTLSVNTASGATFAGVISGSGGLTVAGASTLTLAGANTYTGPTTARSGILKLDFSTAGAPASNIISTSSNLALEGGTLGLTGSSGAVNSQSFNGTTVSSGASVITLTQNGATSLTASLGTITRTAGATLNFSIAPSTSGIIATTTNTNDASGILGPWASAGTGASLSYVTINGSNQIVAYAGATTATAADLSNVTSGTVNYKYSAATTLAGNQTGNTLQYTGAATTTALGTRSLTLNGLMNAGTGLLTISGAAGNPGLVIGASGELDIVSNAQNIAISAVVSGTGSLIYSGLGTLTLSGINTYTGTTTINSGVLAVNGGNAIADTGQVNIAGTAGTRSLSLSANETIGSLKGVAGATVTLGSRTLTTGDAGNTTFAGVISGAGGGLTKQGAGTFTLSGINTYTGATTITAGTLLVSGSLTSNVTASGGTFGGTGTVNGAAIGAGAALQGGDGSVSGALSLAGNVTLADDAIVKLTLGGSGAHSSLTRTGGTWTFDLNQAFSFIDAGATAGVYNNLITGLTGTETGLSTIATWTIANAGWVGTFSLNGSSIDLNLTAVPEPTTWSVLAFSLTAVYIFRRRARR